MEAFITNSSASIPRVTEILRPFTGFDQVPRDILERAAARGTSVHALCAGLARGNWLPDGMIDKDLIGYVNSFKKWASAQVRRFIVIEKRYTDLHSQYTGQVDFVIEGTDNKIYLTDLKTSSRPQKTYRVQMAAYDNLLKQNNIRAEGVMLIYLDKDGEFPDIDAFEDMEEEFSVFVSALQCHNYFKKRKKDGTKECVSANLGDHGGAKLHTEGFEDSQ